MTGIDGNVVLETQGLTKSYGKSRGIEDICIKVEKGEIFGFIGPNGAGKSTTIRTIMGLLHQNSGTVKMFGKEVMKNSADVRSKIGFVPSDLNYYDGLSVKQMLEYSAGFYKNGAKERINLYCERLKLEQKRKINDLSLGNKKKVALVQALLHKPELLILDEPTSGLDPLIQSRFYEILREEQSRGCTIFFSSHTLSEVERLCRRVAIIRDGRIVNISGLDELRKMYLKRFRLILAEGQTPDKSAFRNVSELKITERSVEGLHTGKADELLQLLSCFQIEDIVIEDPSLEEIFMHYYSEPDYVQRAEQSDG